MNNNSSTNILQNTNNSIFYSSMNLIDKLQQDVTTQIKELQDFDVEKIKDIPSNLDLYDYMFSFTFGLLGGFLSTNDSIKKIFDNIHIDASKENPTTILGKLLNHNGDAMDKIGRQFINRDGEKADLMFHRLLFGHDPLSFGKDNPFVLMVNSNGLIKGIISVFRHLIADTFSKQGLPIPGHSFFDYHDSNGNLSNRLKDFSAYIAKNNRAESQKVFSNTFTIKAQDISSQGFVWAATKAYCFARNIENDERKCQIKIIAYSSNFFSSAIIGYVKNGGIPSVNYPALVALFKELASLYLGSYKEIKKLEKITNEIIRENEMIEKSVYSTGRDLISYNSAEGYINELKEQDKKFNNLINFFEEE